jgi:hypothetical protein
MNFTPEQINSFKTNGLTYREKLLNQSRESLKIVEDIAAGWKGSEAQARERQNYPRGVEENVLHETADG